MTGSFFSHPAATQNDSELQNGKKKPTEMFHLEAADTLKYHYVLLILDLAF